jgi:hypothetical protein
LNLFRGGSFITATNLSKALESAVTGESHISVPLSTSVTVSAKSDQPLQADNNNIENTEPNKMPFFTIYYPLFAFACPVALIPNTNSICSSVI